MNTPDNSDLTKLPETARRVGSSDVVRRLRDTELYVDACDEAADLIEWAETLLCNSLPMSHCSQAEWDKLIKQWRDKKHGISPNEKLTDSRE